MRVAFFADTYWEVDGVANTARQYEAYVRRAGLPFLLVHGGYEQERIVRAGDFTRVELPRSRFGFVLDHKHDFDLAFLRHVPRVEQLLREFGPDVLHITGPSDVGILGALAAHRLRIPLLASWHTNLHQYAERRAMPGFFFLPSEWRKKIGAQIREISFQLIARFYRIPRVLMAPNRELIGMLEKVTGKPCFLMARGVDTDQFHPGRRDKRDGSFTIGYVGRITVEKNVGMLVEIERALRAAGVRDYQFLIVGQGGSEEYLRNNLERRTLTGVLQGEELARAYANMDVFLFPSKTDTFGNVVLEAMASGVPALVTNEGGPQYVVRPGETGFICRTTAEFVEQLLWLRNNPFELAMLRKNARQQAEGMSWSRVFQALYLAYAVALEPGVYASRRTGLKLPLRPELES